MDWRIIYSDKTVLDQIKDGHESNFLTASIEKPVTAIAFVDAEGREFRFSIPRGAEPFARRRRVRVVGLNESSDEVLFHILGYRKKDGKEKYLFIDPQGNATEHNTLEG
ncbi:MAG: hypothetical protein V1899_03010 [Planctomycetota bacterium]